jgi:hypothetical protein
MCQKSSSQKILILDWGHCTLSAPRFRKAAIVQWSALSLFETNLACFGDF